MSITVLGNTLRASHEIHLHHVSSEVPRLIDLYTRWCAWKGTPADPPDFSHFDHQEYLQTIVNEEPPVRLWAEEALYRVRKRQSQSGAMDSLLEKYWAGGRKHSA